MQTVPSLLYEKGGRAEPPDDFIWGAAECKRVIVLINKWSTYCELFEKVLIPGSLVWLPTNLRRTSTGTMRVPISASYTYWYLPRHDGQMLIDIEKASARFFMFLKNSNGELSEVGESYLERLRFVDGEKEVGDSWHILVGDTVEVVAGTWQGRIGKVKRIKSRVVSVSFGIEGYKVDVLLPRDVLRAVCRRGKEDELNERYAGLAERFNTSGAYGARLRGSRSRFRDGLLSDTT